MKLFCTNLICCILLISANALSGCATCQESSHSTQDTVPAQNDYAWWQYVLAIFTPTAYDYAKQNAENQSQ
jgi:hypothetical protein